MQDASGCLITGFCLLNNAAIAVIHATNSIGIINKPFVESTGFLEALESVIIPKDKTKDYRSISRLDKWLIDSDIDMQYCYDR